MSLRLAPSPCAPKVAELIEAGALSAVFQPIVDFDGGTILGYEGLIRGPAGTALETPGELFAQASREGLSVALEHAAAETCVAAFAGLGCEGKLFLNFSAEAIVALGATRERVMNWLGRHGMPMERIVLELTEQCAIDNVAGFEPVVAALRETGAQFALDDYGTANASMNLWVRLQPDVVKIDRFFIDDIANDPLKFEAVRAMQRFASASGARLVAEGIEKEADLIVVRDMGIAFGQGFFFGRPAAHAPCTIDGAVRDVLDAAHIAVFPGATRSPLPGSPSGGVAAAKMLVAAPALPITATNNEVLDLFNRLPALHALAIVENDEPVALVNRRSFMDRYALPYHRELFGKRPCLLFANASPVVIEKSMTVEQMAKLLASDDQRYLADGFVITDQGRYLGLGTGESLVRAVTEVRIEAARYANPLTFLPGNIPISSHIARLVEHRAQFHACYVDLNHFKPFNDRYGYWQGDEVLKFAAAVLADACDPTRDFLGHVGGDDFLILFQSEDWPARVQAAIDAFNSGALRFYADEDREAGGIHGEDRRGNPTFFSFVTMAIGCVRVNSAAGARYGSEEIASVAALAKHRAKQEPSGSFLIDIDEGAALLHMHEPAFGGARAAAMAD
ncbi:phosphodiesterase [Trinickia caryophylli]|uniref:Diguanylate cyclase/phosphodiesterase n=1 Tax=Trinickia caryophylli TaxID=28094 RepID=A0A1X7ELP6_TRICW|nr:phosphodiesterase [Trinickia caryophylli]PMS10312.1 phosphodiesterase [Trinickia caryophylli]TRX18782.1 phosphodiesterase [Trinickia caryophylli]WQE10421.1 phosphodiesterase [Trinickia caryophylli]SMF36089.1 diguanylate cyclase/phosphodiesterase [Trinickia caryophylli]GLU32768.1 GGDEF domain-containing protein [Trinickia caryophylli]